jgi:hypothetical protein
VPLLKWPRGGWNDHAVICFRSKLACRAELDDVLKPRSLKGFRHVGRSMFHRVTQSVVDGGKVRCIMQLRGTKIFELRSMRLGC